MPASHSNGQPSYPFGIQPAKLRRLGATLLLANRNILDPKKLLRNPLVRPLDEQQERLKSRRLFVSAAQKLLNNASKLDIRIGQWTDFINFMISSQELIPGSLVWACIGKTQPFAN